MNKAPILPPQTIGILGGGQLGRMIALKAREMGYGIAVLDPTPDSPCGQVADRQVIGAFDDRAGAEELAGLSDVLTYEFENISADLTARLSRNHYLPQGGELLRITQNRHLEKETAQAAGLQTAPYALLHQPAALEDAVDTVGLPAILKTVSGGYDGKGQYLIQDSHEIPQVRRELSSIPYVLESVVPFRKELSVIVARGTTGEVQPYPVVENVHREGILAITLAPARVSAHVQSKAKALATALAEHVGLVGLLAVELFLLADDTLLVNEMAPRPHNSGHCTMQACSTSQFEQHIRAICGLPLGNSAIYTPTVMFNVLGEHLERVLGCLPSFDGSCKLHLYGKREAKPKRKMGHLNIIGESVEECVDKLMSLDITTVEDIL